MWSRHCGGGAVFSSPSFHPSLRQLYVASLGGRLLCLHPVSSYTKHTQTSCSKLCKTSDRPPLLCPGFFPQDSGEVLWTHSVGVPIFSSPNASSGHVLIGSVDGNISCLSSSGEVVSLGLQCVDSPLYSKEAVKKKNNLDHTVAVCGPFGIRKNKVQNKFSLMSEHTTICVI